MPTADHTRWRAEAVARFAHAARTTDPRARAQAYLEVGDLYRDHVGEPHEASRCYLGAVEADPAAAKAALARLTALADVTGDVEITANLISALSRAQRWPEVVAQLEAQADTVDTAEERAGLLLAAAMTARRRIGGRADGRRALLAAAQCTGPETAGEVLGELEVRLEQQPDDPALAVSAARLHVSAGRHASAFALLEATAERVQAAPARASLLLDAAILADEALNTPAEAARLLIDAANADPHLRRSVNARLDDLGARHGGDEAVATLLAGHWHAAGDPVRLQQALERAVEGGDPGTRAARRLALARHTEERLGDPARAFALYREGLSRGEGDLAPFAEGMRRTGALGVPGALRSMSEQFERLELWRPLVGALEDAADVAADDGERAALLYRAGEILEKHLDDLEGAMRHYVKAFQTRPREGRYLAAGERVYRRRGEWRMVDKLLALQVRVAPEAGLRRRLLEEQARVRHRHLDDPLGAYEALRAAMAQGGADVTRRVLRDLVCDDAAFTVIEDGLRRRAREAGGVGAARLYLEVAALQIDVRDRPLDGAAALQAAADAVPDDVALFETVRDRIADLGDEARLARWLGRAHRRPLPLATRVEALALAGQLHLDADRAGEAVGPLREALRLAPRDPGLLRRALAAAGAADPRAEITLLEQALDGEIGPEQPTRLDTLVWWRRLARVRTELGDGEGAARALRQILRADPLDDAAYAGLRAQLEAGGDEVGLAELLHGRLTAVDAAGHVPPEPLLRALMGLAERVLEEPALAIDCAERLLARDAADREARAALHRLFERTGHRVGRLKLLRLELADEDDDARRAAIAARLAELAEQPPTDPDALVIARQVQVDLSPDHLEALDALADALQRSGRVGEMAEVLGRRWAVAPTGDNLDVLRARAMALQSVGELDAAEQAWADVLAYHPDDDGVLESLQQVAAARGDHEAVHALYWRRHDVQVDAEAAVRLLVDAAKVAERGLKDPTRAAEAWRRVLQWKPFDDGAEQALLRLFVKARDWPALMQLGQERLHRLQGEPKRALAQKLARLARDGAADEDTAVALWQAVHAEAPQDREALEALIDTAERRRDPVTAARLLGRLVQATTNAQDRRQALERRAAVLENMGDLTGAAETWAEVRALVPDARAPVSAVRRLALAQGDHFAAAKALVAELRFVQAPAEALALNQELARLSDRLGDQLGGMAAWERVRSLAEPGTPDEAEALDALKRLYADLGRTDELVRVLRALMDRAPDDATRAAHLLDAARLLEDLRRDYAEAFDCRVRAWRLTPQPPPTMLSELRRLAEAGGLWARYAEVLGVAQARAPSGEAEVAILLERAAVEADQLNAPERALGTAQLAFELDPRDGDAFAALGQYARQTEAWSLWVDALRAVGQRADGKRRAELLLEAAALTEEALGDKAGAFELYAEAAALGSEPAEAALVARAEEDGRWGELIALYTAWRDEAHDPLVKVGYMRRLGNALEQHAGETEKAFEQHLLALQIDPHDTQTRSDVWRLAEAIDGWGYVARVLALKARETSRPGARVELLRLLAEVHGQRLGDPEKALDTLKRAFSADPADPGLRDSLRALAQGAGLARTVAGLFEEEAGWVEARVDRLALLREAAALHAEAGEASEAARVLGRVLEMEPEAEHDLDALLALRRRAGDALALANDLERLSRKAPAERREGLLEELAQLYTGPLEAPAKAEEVFRRLLTLRDGDADTFEALVQTLEARKAWRELSEAFARRIRDAGSADRLALLRRRADVLRLHLGKAREAYELLVEVAQAHPEDLGLLRTLAERAAAADAHGLLVACAERTAAVVGPDELPEVLTLIGRVARDRFGDDRKARKVLLRALELQPGDLELAREVAALLTARRRHGELVALYERVGPGVLAEPDQPADAPAVVARHALAVATLKADQLYDPEGAVATLDALLAAQPEHLEGWRRLHALAAKASDAASLERAARRLAELVPGEAVDTLAGAARKVSRLGDEERAVGLWRAVLSLDADHGRALQAVKRFAERRADWDLLADELAARAEATAAPGPVWAELGRLHRDARGDADAAEQAFQAALSADPDDVGALEALVALTRQRGDLEGLDDLTARAEARLDALGAAASDDLRALTADLLLGRAERALAAGQPAAAREALTRAHAAAPGRDDVAVALADALVDDGELAEAAALYADRAVPSQGGPGAAEAKARAHLRRGRAFRAVGQARRALRHFEVAAQRPSTRTDALEALAALQVEAGRWEAAVRLQLKLAEAVPPTDPRHARALTDAGRLAEDRLGKPTRALKSYRKALDAGSDDPDLLRRLLALLQDLHRADEALAIADRLLSHRRFLDPNARAEVLCARGSALAELGRLDEAVQAWRAAQERSPLMLPAVEGLLGHLDQVPAAEQREILRQIHQGAVGEAGPGAAHGAEVLDRLARCLLERGDDLGALEVYEALLARDPDRLGVRTALARLHQRLGSAEDGDRAHVQHALAHHLAFVRARPGDAAALEALEHLTRQLDQPDWTTLVARVRAMITGERPGPAVDGPLVDLRDGPRLGRVGDAPWRLPMGLLVRALHSWIGPDVAALLGRPDPRPRPALSEALALEVAALTDALGLPARQWCAAPGAGLRRVRFEPLTFGVAPDFGARPPAERRFLLGRLLEASRGPAAWVTLAPADEIHALVGAALALAMGEAGSEYALISGADPERVAVWGERLLEWLPSGKLDALARLGGPVIAAGPEAFAAWVDAVHRLTERVGFVLANDLRVALEALAADAEYRLPARLKDATAWRGLFNAVPGAEALFHYAFGVAFWAPVLGEAPAGEAEDETALEAPAADPG